MPLSWELSTSGIVLGAVAVKTSTMGVVPASCCCLVTQSCPSLLWTIARQAPLSLGFPRQEHWSRLPFPFPGHLPDPGIKLASPELAGRFLSTEPPGKSMWSEPLWSLKPNEGDVCAYNYNKMSQTPVAEKYQWLISDKTHRKGRTQIVSIRDVFRTRIHWN